MLRCRTPVPSSPQGHSPVSGRCLCSGHWEHEDTGQNHVMKKTPWGAAEQRPLGDGGWGEAEGSRLQILQRGRRDMLPVAGRCKAAGTTPAAPKKPGQKEGGTTAPPPQQNAQ